MQILNALESEAFDSPPVFNSIQRKQFFELTPKVESMIKSTRTPINAVRFVVTLGYFKAPRSAFLVSRSVTTMCNTLLRHLVTYQE